MNALPAKQEFRWSYMKKGKQVYNICTQFVMLHGLAVGLLASASSLAYANPTDGTVVAGSATITSAGSEVDINQSSNRAIINWGSFDIANGETTRFIQPGTNSLTLNRVTTSGQITTINGNLTANGHVLVINPNGVLIGPNGNVDVAGFVASSADINDNTFMTSTGAMQFDKAGNANATVENQGHITVKDTGLGLLVAPTVKNSGIIEGNLAKLQMGAGDTFGVDLYGDGLLNLAVATSGEHRTMTASNAGKILASGGKILMTAAAASDVVDSVINTSGVVSATSLVSKGGEIILTGAGAHVSVAGTVDASGKTGGGKIRIGGDAKGADTLAKASTVDIASGAKISANATDNGDGGNIAVWSEDATTTRGTFEAKGGANGGNGGLVETSGKNILDVGGTLVDASAASGALGSWLLDPTTMNVDAAMAAAFNASFGNVDLTTSDGLTFSANISLQGIGSHLSASSGAGGITMNNGYIRTNGGDINFNTTGTITLNGAGGTQVLFTRGGDINFTADKIKITNAAFGTSACGNFLCAGGDVNFTGTTSVSLNSTIISTTGGLTAGGINLLKNNGTAWVTGTDDQKEAFFGNAANTFETTRNGGTINIKGATVGGNSNCFDAGGVACSVIDPVAPLNLTVQADSLIKTYGDALPADSALTYHYVSGTLQAGDSYTGSLTRDPGYTVGTYNITQGSLFVLGAYYSYNLVVLPGTLTINPALLSLVANDQSKTYGTDLSLGTTGFHVGSGTLFYGDTVTGETLSSLGAPASAAVGSYAINGSNATGTGLSNYTISYLPGTLLVGQRALTLVADDQGKTYGTDLNLGTTAFHIGSGTLLAGDSITGETLTSTGATGTAGVGSYAIVGSNATGTGLSNYNISYVNGNLTISPALLTLVANDQSKTYGSALSLGTTGFHIGSGSLFNGDTVTGETLASTGAAATAGVGNYAITGSNATGTGLGNYTISYTDGNLLVNPALLTLVANDQSKTYGSALSLGTTGFHIGSGSLFNGDTVAGETLSSTGAPATASVGNYAITGSDATGTGLSNYTISYTNGNLLVNPALLTLVANDQSKTYGSALSLGTTGFHIGSGSLFNGDTVTGETLSSTGAPATAVVGNYAITGSNATGTGLSNYTISYTNGNLHVNLAPLTLVADDQSKTYGTALTLGTTAFHIGSGTLFNGDTITGETLTSTGAAATAGVGNYAIFGTSAIGPGIANYAITFVNGNLTISPALLTLVANDQSKTYGSALSLGTTGFHIGSGSLFNGDTVTGETLASTGAAATAGVGNYAIVGSNATGTGLSNYTISYTDGNLLVNPALLTLVANDQSKTYGSALSLGTTGFHIGSGSLFNGDTVTGETLASTGAAATAGVGNYAITGSNATGTGLSNYTISYTNGNLLVNPALLTLVANDQSKTYGSALSLGTTGFHIGSGSLFNGDTVTGETLSSTGAPATASVGNYAIVGSNATGTGLGNYTISYTNGNLLVNPKALTITANSTSKTYGSTTTFAGTEFTTSGLVNGDTVSSETLASTGAAAGASVGDYAITGSNAVGSGLSNYTISYVDGNLHVSPKLLTITANSTSKTYGTTLTFNGTEYTTSGLVNGDTVTSETLTSAGAPAGAAVGNYAIVGSNALGTGLSNYTISYVNGNLAIGTMALTLVADDQGKTYGTNLNLGTTAFHIGSGSLLAGDSITGETLTSTGATGTAGVGNYAIVGSNATGTGLSNYTITYVNGNLHVSPKALTITSNDASKTYGSTTTFAGTEFTASGLVNGDTVTGETLASTGAAAGASVGDYAITGSNAVGSGLSNYTISYVDGNLHVSPKALTITSSDATKTYGSTTTFAGTEFTTSGLVNGDTVTSETLASTGAAAGASVGDYAITGSNAVGSGLSNYTISYVDGNLHVSPKLLTITSSDAGKTYGSTTTFAGTEFTTSGLVNGDTVTSETLASTGAAAGASVGDYAITGSNAVGSGLSNYTISYVDGNLHVSPKALTITSSDATKTYGDTTTFAGTEFTTSGLVNGDTVTSETLASAGAAAGATVGGYDITGSNAVGSGLSNYTISYVNGTLTVGKADLTITASDASKTYGNTTTFAGTEFTTSGLVNGDTVTSETLASAGAAAGATVGGYDITGSDAVGSGLSNYNISYVNGTLTVGKADLTITASNASKTYGNTTTFAGTEFTTSGLVNGDTVDGETLASTGAAGSATVGDYAITGSDAVGSGLSNYNISYVDGNLHVSPAALTITANDQSKTQGQVFTFAGTEFTTSGLVNGDSVDSLGLSSLGAPAPAAPGAYAITADNGEQGLAVNGTGLSNYDITFVEGTLTVKPAPVTGPFTQIDPLGRPIVSYADQVIVYNAPFEQVETLTLGTDVSIKLPPNSDASTLSNLEPAAGGDDNTPQTAEGLANVEPAAGGNASGGTPAGNDVDCANNFLDNKACPIQ